MATRRRLWLEVLARVRPRAFRIAVVAKARVKIERVPSFAGFNAVFRAMLDGRQVAVIPPGQMRTVTTDAGDHELYIRIQRRKMSRTLTLHLQSDQELLVRCGRPRTAFEGILRLIRFQKPDYESVIPVEIVDPHDSPESQQQGGRMEPPRRVVPARAAADSVAGRSYERCARSNRNVRGRVRVLIGDDQRIHSQPPPDGASSS
jgi:hypothetical protein